LEDIAFYFSPVDISDSSIESFDHGTIGSTICRHRKGDFPKMKKGDIALLYVPEFRNSRYDSVGKPRFADCFARLYAPSSWKKRIVDLGTIEPGKTIDDTYFALSSVIATLVKHQIIPIVIGGSHDLTVPMYRGYASLEQYVNLCSVDSRLDLGKPTQPIYDSGYISHLIAEQPCYLFNYANIGMQIPFVEKTELDLFEQLYFDYCRLGELTADFKRSEPYLRNSDIVSIDMTSIRYSDLATPFYRNPNGFYAEQICQLARYAGISDKLSSFGVFNYFPESTSARNVSELLAQLIWYFIDGVNARMGDFPIGTRKNYHQATVHIADAQEDIVFYKSNKSARWWMEVPYPAQGNSQYERHYLVPCNYEDYQRALQNEIPDLWWKTYQKLI